ncbi:hypothetical protein DY468_23895 [Rhodopseudomonas sp. BR0M22]|nr:hypothetical protein [Rhodopseudomonas sp. BR0M22]
MLRREALRLRVGSGVLLKIPKMLRIKGSRRSRALAAVREPPVRGARSSQIEAHCRFRRRHRAV